MNSRRKNRFQDFVFIAAEVNSAFVPTGCLVHFEILVPQEHESGDVQDSTISKVMWVKNVKTGEIMDLSYQPPLQTNTIHHSKSYSSGLCDGYEECICIEYPSRSYSARDSSTPFRSSTYCKPPQDTFKSLLSWKVANEIDCLTRMPRDWESAISPSDQARVITTKVNDNHPHHLITYVNNAWENLCGYTGDEVKGNTLKIIQGEETDRDVVESINEAIYNSCDISALLRNYKKNGEPFMNRVRIVPLHTHQGNYLTELHVASLNDVGFPNVP